jgi:hypothetical protein
MKAQLAILLMAYSTTGAFAQSTDVKVDIPRRERNLKNWYTDPPQIQVFPADPSVHVFGNRQPDNSLFIRVPAVKSRQPGKTVISVPVNEFEPSNANNPKIGNFEVNTPLSSHRPLNLPPGQSSRVLNPNSFINPIRSQPKIASKPAAQANPADSGSNWQKSSGTTALRYNSETPLPMGLNDGLKGSSNFHVKTAVTGKKFKPGDLINAP